MSADICRISPGLYSVLLGSLQFTVYVDETAEGVELWVGHQSQIVSLADPRDSPAASTRSGRSGPTEIRAQMPGRVIKLLVAAGDTVSAGQGLIVVEAMKMQNEVKSPRDGIVGGLHTEEGATVAAGERLLTLS